MRRGDVAWANLNPRSGSEQKGRRPVIVISHDGFNLTPGWCSIIIVPVSTSMKEAGRGPTAVRLDARTGGLSHDSVALCHQVTTLDRNKLGEPFGRLSPGEMSRVEAGLKAAMDLS